MMEMTRLAFLHCDKNGNVRKAYSFKERDIAVSALLAGDGDDVLITTFIDDGDTMPEKITII